MTKAIETTKATKATATKATKATATKATKATATKATKATATKAITTATIKSNAIKAIAETMAEVKVRAALYGNKTHRENVNGLGAFAAFRNAVQIQQAEYFTWLAAQANMKTVNDCESFIKAQKIIGFYPKHWPNPNSVYNGAMARKNQGRNSAWQFVEDAPNGGIIRNMDDESQMLLPEFLTLFRICKMFDKRRDTENANRRGQELHASVMQKISAIEKANRRENKEEAQAMIAALKQAFTDAAKAKVKFTDAEMASYHNAIGNGVIISANDMPKSVSAEIAAAQKAATEKAQKEAAEKLAAERAEKMAARRDAEKAQKEAAAQKAAWDKERERLRTENANILAKQNEHANKWRNILPLLKAIPENLDNASPDEMKDFLKRLAKQI